MKLTTGLAVALIALLATPLAAREKRDPAAAAALDLTYIANDGFLMTAAGRKVLIDALFDDGGRFHAPSQDALAAFPFQQKRVDVVLLHRDDVSPFTRQRVTETIRPRRIVAMHLPPARFTEESREFRAAHPRAIVFRQSMERRSLRIASGSREVANGGDPGRQIIESELGAPPGSLPQAFAPGIVSDGGTTERSLALSPAGDEIFFTRSRGWPDSRILHMKKEGGDWSAPGRAAFLGGAGATQPVFSPDGQHLYYSSNYGREDVRHYSLFRSRKQDGGWSSPEPVIDIGGALMMEFHPSVTRDGSVYFLYWDFARQTGDIYVARRAGEGWAEPVIVPAPISTEHNEVRPTVDPDERYLLFESDRPGGYGGTDIYVTVRNADGTWEPPRSLGPDVNTADVDDTPNLSPDGRYWFFSRDGDVYWRLAPEGLLAPPDGAVAPDTSSRE